MGKLWESHFDLPLGRGGLSLGLRPCRPTSYKVLPWHNMPRTQYQVIFWSILGVGMHGCRGILIIWCSILAVVVAGSGSGRLAVALTLADSGSGSGWLALAGSGSGGLWLGPASPLRRVLKGLLQGKVESTDRLPIRCGLATVRPLGLAQNQLNF